LPGRHRSPGLLNQSRLRVPLALSGVLALVAVAAVTVRIVSADAAGCSGGVPVKVVVTPELTDVVQDVAARWTKTKPSVDGRCVTVSVTGAPSAQIASSLTVLAGGAIDVAAKPEATPTEDQLPTVWVPDSTAWLTRVAAVDRNAFADDAKSIASSPVVVAMPTQLATVVGWPARPIKPAALKPLLTAGKGVVKPGLAEPRRETASLAGAMIFGDALATSPGDLPTLVKIFRDVVKKQDTMTLLKAFGSEVTAAPASEQAVLAFNTVAPVKLVPVQFEKPEPVLDFPFAIRANIPRESAQAAEAFRAALAEPYALEALARHGFRTVDGAIGSGFPTSAGASGAAVTGTPIANAEKVQRALGLWTAANTASRSLALFDLTSSMVTPMQTDAGAKPRAQVMVEAAQSGLTLFTAETELSMWGFAAGHRQIAPFAQLTGKVRGQLDGLLSSAEPEATNSASLYVALRDAYKTMQDGFDPLRPNIIIVLTDGGDSRAGGARLQQFQLDLQRLADATKPIRVIIIGIDVPAKSADAADLKAIAKAAGGGYFPLTSPDQIQSIFLNALLGLGPA
jgi:hypothetical protein